MLYVNPQHNLHSLHFLTGGGGHRGLHEAASIESPNVICHYFGDDNY